MLKIYEREISCFGKGLSYFDTLPSLKSGVSCAIEDNAILVTLDKDLLHNKKIEEQYKIKIRHPKELI